MEFPDGSAVDEGLPVLVWHPANLRWLEIALGLPEGYAKDGAIIPIYGGMRLVVQDRLPETKKLREIRP